MASLVNRLVVLYHRDRVFTANEVKRMNRYEHGRRVKEWRHAFWVLGLEAIRKGHLFGPPIEHAMVTVYPRLKSKRGIDSDAVAPCAKAALDGATQAKILVDDGPKVVIETRYRAPKMGCKADGLVLMIQEVPLADETVMPSPTINVPNPEFEFIVYNRATTLCSDLPPCVLHLDEARKEALSLWMGNS